jgi:hypothetical protein
MPFDLSTAKKEEKQGFDISTAKPDAPIKKEPLGALGALSQLKDILINKYIKPEAESITQMGTGLVGSTVGGIAGTAQALNPFASEGAGARTSQAIQEAMTYQPDTPQQGMVTGALGEVGELINKIPAGLGGIGKLITSGNLSDAVSLIEQVEKDPTRYLGEETLEATDSPLLATMAQLFPDVAIEATGLGMASKAAKAKKLTGVPDETVKYLEDAGINTKDLSDTNIQQIKTKIAEKQAPQIERQQAFKEEGIEPTRGDITQDFEQQKAESQLFEESGVSGDQMRGARLEQSRKLRENIDSMVDDLGVPAEVGESLKQALSGRKKTLKADRKVLYDELAEQTKGMNIPVITDQIIEAIPDSRTLRDMQSAHTGAFEVVDNALKDYGLIDGGKNVTPLSLENFESFRKALNRAEAADFNIGVVTSPIRKALDDAIGELTDSLAKNGNANISELAKEARKSHISLKTEFDEKALTSQLIDLKKKSVTPKIEGSNVYQKLSSKSTPIEQFAKVVDSLKQSGNSGVKALSDLKNRMILDILDTAYGAGSRKIRGERTFGVDAFQKTIKNLQPKLDVLFSPTELKRFENMMKISESIRPPSGAIPKGSAGYFIDSLNKLGASALIAKVPLGGAMLMDKLTSMSKATKSKKTFDNAMKNPEFKDTVKLLEQDYPSLYAALGVGALITERENSVKQ